MFVICFQLFKNKVDRKRVGVIFNNLYKKIEKIKKKIHKKQIKFQISFFFCQ